MRLNILTLLLLALPAAADNYTTKTPYAPHQAAASYEPVPAGFAPIQTQLVARHGSRGMTGMKVDLALLNLCKQAQAEHALTPLGVQLLADLEQLIRVNALLGAGVASKPGYGNLSATGIAEHTQLAQRVTARLPALFEGAGQRRILVEHSGVDRARDSAAAFMASLLHRQSALAPLVDEDGANRYTLYFHKLNAKTDGVPPEDWRGAVFRASQDYQAYLASPALEEKQATIHADPRLATAAQTVLKRLFKASFLAKLKAGDISAANTGSFVFETPDGKFKNTLKGDGKTSIDSPVEALLALSDVYDIAPGLAQELGRNFSAYLPAEQAHLLAMVHDAEDFYEKGPGMTEQHGVTWHMAEGLLADFFRDLDDPERLAHFRFTHAEIITPFAAALGVPGKATPLPAAQQFSYKSNPWRGADVAPYAANIQWDSFRHPDGRRIVRMLYNEAETDFKPACDGARIAPASHFYEVVKLKACYLP